MDVMDYWKISTANTILYICLYTDYYTIIDAKFFHHI
jgi:hypothetical protein